MQSEQQLNKNMGKEQLKAKLQAWSKQVNFEKD